ncbi:hypothetical protein HDU85_001428, partial [Gaertneriomyces sp. JEL0708]
MSFCALTDAERQQLEDVYSTMKVGRDNLYYAVKRKYPEFKGSQRAVLYDFLYSKEEWQNHRKPDRPTVVAPLNIQKPGYLQIDMVSMRTYTDAGYVAFVHMIDGFTKKSWARPLTNEREVDMRDAVEDMVKQCQREGKEIRIVQTDQGSHFQRIFRAMLQSHGIKHIYSQAGRPESNAYIERRGSDIKKQLYGLMNANDDRKWVSRLPTVINNMNVMRSFATGHTPNDLEAADPEMVAQAQAKITKNISKRYHVNSRTKPLHIGQRVRIKRDLKSSVKKYGKAGFWSKDVYEVAERTNSTYANILASYRLEDVDGKILKGRYPKSSLLAVPPILKEDGLDESDEEEEEGEVDEDDVPSVDDPLEENELIREQNEEAAEPR